MTSTSTSCCAPCCARNIELIFATFGSEAKALLSRRRPDLILMDVDLPDIDGVGATRRIRTVERLASVPVVMLTGHADKDVVVRRMTAGATDFLVKKLNKDILKPRFAVA